MIKSIKKAMDILTILSNCPDTPVTLGQLAEQAGINKSTCAHIVDTLCESFYVERVSRKEGYRLGPWAYMLSRYGPYRNSIVTVATPILKWLHKNTDASVFISVVCNGKKYIPYHIDKANLLPRSDGSIIQGRLEATATGLLLLANMDAETMRSIFSHRKRVGESGITEITPELEKQLQSIRSSGYCSLYVHTPPHRSFAFGIADGGKITAAVGVLYSAEMDSPEYQAEIKKRGRVAAREISRRLSAGS